MYWMLVLTVTYFSEYNGTFFCRFSLCYIQILVFSSLCYKCNATQGCYEMWVLHRVHVILLKWWYAHCFKYCILFHPVRNSLETQVEAADFPSAFLNGQIDDRQKKHLLWIRGLNKQSSLNYKIWFWYQKSNYSYHFIWWWKYCKYCVSQLHSEWSWSLYPQQCVKANTKALHIQFQIRPQGCFTALDINATYKEMFHLWTEMRHCN